MKRVAEATSLRSAKERIRHLESLVEASKMINSTLDLERLLSLILDVALENTYAEAGTIYIVEQDKRELWSKVTDCDTKIEIRLPFGHGIAGTVAETGETVNIPDAYKDPRFNQTIDEQTGFRTKSILCMPMRNKSGDIIGVFQILNKKRGGFGAEDKEFLDALSVHAALAVENAKLFQEALEKKRLESELAVAKEIQEHLLPRGVPNVAGYEFAAVNYPCYEVGGDYFDFLVRHRDCLGFAIGDVAGKGIPASLLMATLRGGLHAQLRTRQTLVKRTKSLNRLIYQCITAGKFITFFHGELCPSSGEITFVNCGHNPPLYVTRKGEFVKLETGGLILGVTEDSQYEEGKIRIDSGEAVVFYTDGVTEARNRQKREYEERRLRKALTACSDKCANAILNSVIEDLKKFSKGADQADDITLMVIKRVD